MMAVPQGSVSHLLANEDALRDGLKEGLCHIVSLAPVKTALGARWSRNEALIQDYVVRNFKRGALEDDLIMRVNEVDYMLVQPSRSPLSALSRATRLARMTLNRFLGQGQVQPDHVRISIIEQAEPGEITARRVPHTQLEVCDDDPAGESLPDEASAPWEAFGTRRVPRHVTLYKRPQGDELEASYFLEPIWNPGHEAVGLFQLRSQTFQVIGAMKRLVDRRDLTARALGIVATRRLRHAREVLENTVSENLSLSVPLSLDGFAHSSSRTAILNSLRQISEQSNTAGRLFIELCDLPCDVSLVRVDEAIAQIKAYVRRATLRVPGHCQDLTQWAQSGADGLILSLSQTGQDSLSERRLLSLRDQTRRTGSFVAVDGVRSVDQAFLCYDCGFREICGEPITRAFGERIESRRLTQAEVWTRKKVA